MFCLITKVQDTAYKLDDGRSGVSLKVSGVKLLGAAKDGHLGLDTFTASATADVVKLLKDHLQRSSVPPIVFCMFNVTGSGDRQKVEIIGATIYGPATDYVWDISGVKQDHTPGAPPFSLLRANKPAPTTPATPATQTATATASR